MDLSDEKKTDGDDLEPSETAFTMRELDSPEQGSGSQGGDIVPDGGKKSSGVGRVGVDQVEDVEMMQALGFMLPMIDIASVVVNPGPALNQLNVSQQQTVNVQNVQFNQHQTTVNVDMQGQQVQGMQQTMSQSSNQTSMFAPPMRGGADPFAGKSQNVNVNMPLPLMSGAGMSISSATIMLSPSHHGGHPVAMESI